MLMTEFRCKWHLLCFARRSSMTLQRLWMLVPKMSKTVINSLKLSPTSIISYVEWPWIKNGRRKNFKVTFGQKFWLKTGSEQIGNLRIRLEKSNSKVEMTLYSCSFVSIGIIHDKNSTRYNLDDTGCICIKIVYKQTWMKKNWSKSIRKDRNVPF